MKMKVYADLDGLEDITNNALLYISRKNAKPDIVELVDLCSLADHDNQVRKEVCEKIKEIADIDDWEEINGYTLKKILDQIQGETNGN